MIKVRINRDETGLVRAFSIRGHAGYAEKGYDIICSAVSAVAYTALGALDEMAGIRGHIEQDGLMEFSLPSDIDGKALETARIILDTMAIGLKQIAGSYKRYVSVVEKEV